MLLSYNHIRFITILLLSMFLFVNCKQKEPDQEGEPVGLISISVPYPLRTILGVSSQNK